MPSQVRHLLAHGPLQDSVQGATSVYRKFIHVATLPHSHIFYTHFSCIHCPIHIAWAAMRFWKSPEQRKDIPERQLSPLDSTKPSLSTLPRKHWVTIVAFVYENKPEDAQTLQLVSSQLYHLVRLRKHQHLTIDLLKYNADEVLAYFDRLRSRNLLPAVHKLTLLENSGASGRTLPADVLRALSERLSSLPNLKNIVFHGSQIPDPIMSAVASLPLVAVSLHLALVADSPASLLPTTRTSPNLSSLTIDLTFFQALDCFGAMQAIKSYVLSSPHLQTLKLRIQQASGHGQSQQYAGLGFKQGEAMPALRELELVGYAFGHQRTDGGRGVELNTKGYPVDGDEIDLWAERFNWASLRRLKIDNVTFALKIMPQLVSLEDFAFDADKSQTDVTSFICGIPTALEKIELPTLAHASLTGLLRHGNTLSELRLHRPDIRNSDWSLEAMDASSLQQIQSGCQRIRTLSLDLPRSGAWPYKTFDILAFFPVLDELELWFELGSRTPEDPVKPFLTSTAAEHIFQYLIRDSPHPSSTLRKLTLHCGDCTQTSTSGAFLSPQASWPRYNRTSFLCTRGLNGSPPAVGSEISVLNLLVPLVRGPGPKATSVKDHSDSKAIDSRRKFGSLLSKRSDRSKNGEDDGAHVQQDSLIERNASERLRVAAQGPQPLSQWVAHY